jgi:translocation and assembly module TamB
MEISGMFSLGFPRRDGGEEINARVRIDRRPVRDLLAAFNLQAYRVEGSLSGDFHLYGPYTRPFGVGRLTIDDGTAYRERFTTASAGLRFEGGGVRLDGIQITKGAGNVSGAAYVGWNGTYSFNAEGRDIAVQSLTIATFANLPPFTGVAHFTAGGSATFDEPRYDVQVDVQDLFFGDEGIGEVKGRLSVRDDVLTYEVEAASPRLAVSGTGRMTIGVERGTGELTFRVADAALDPYVRAFKPDFSPYTTATASGTIRVIGDLYDVNTLRVLTTVERLDMRVVDYRLRNQGPIQLAVDGQTLRVETLRVVGEDTALDLTGSLDLAKQALSLQAHGAANLAVLQGFVRDIRSSGRADVSALIGGTVARPVVSGQALVTQGRLRHFSFPHALEDLNGVVTFNASGIRLDDPGFTTPLNGKLGGGTVSFGGRIGISGYALSEFDVTATGKDMRLRFPEGMRSVVDATLALQGPPASPLLSGSVTVQNAMWTSGFDSTATMFQRAPDDAALPASTGALASGTALALRYDVRILAPSTLRIENNQAQIAASAELNLRGTFERPLLFGRADIDRGDVRFEGRRYQVTRGSLDFANPTRIQPFFDVEAETRVRVPNQTYRVTLRLTGTTDRMQPTFESDPPLAPLDVLTLLFSDTAPTGDIELASLRQPNQREQEILQARATRALTGVLSDEVGRVVQDTFGVDTFQITPMLVDPYQQSSRLNVNPAARVTIGKRISDRLYLTYTRSLSSSRLDEIILLEYDQNDRLGWVLSQNEDRTYALEVRKRHLF